MQIDGTYCYTGGRPFSSLLPTVVFIHGAQNDHSVWALQSRYFAHHGFNVLAVDLPGHGRSAGPALTSVDAMADWLLGVLDGAEVSEAILIGHSMGSLIALEAAHRAPHRVRGLGLVGSTYPMKVSDALLSAARDDEPTAIDMVNLWSHSAFTHKPSCPAPGFSVLGMSRRLMQRMSALNPEQLFYTDFAACNAYTNGEAAAASVRCPVLFVLGKRDMMTPPRSAKAFIGMFGKAQTVQIDAGHALMAEKPDEVLDALHAFAATRN